VKFQECEKKVIVEASVPVLRLEIADRTERKSNPVPPLKQPDGDASLA